MTNQSSVTILPAEKAPTPKQTVERRGRTPLWPLEDMKVGEAIEIPSDKVQSLRQKCSNMNRAQEAYPEKDRKRWSAGEAEDGKFYVWRHK